MIRSLTLAAAAALSTGTALACSSTAEVMAHFENVKNAYVEKAPSMTPEQFPIWTGYLERFGDSMGKGDFAGACAALDQASLELGFGVAATVAAPAPAPAPAPQPATPQPAQTEVTELPAPQPQPQPQEQPAAQPQPQPAPASADSGWKECPRGRCWVHGL